MLGSREEWLLDPSVTFLNHGSFGACPRPVLEAQSLWRTRMEERPVEFLDRALPSLLTDARAAAADFLDADAEGLVFVPNATAGANVVARALALGEGDEVVLTDHAYGAVRHAFERVCADAGARLVIVSIPLPFPPDDIVREAIVAAVTDRTRLVVIDHVSSSTAAIFPAGHIVRASRERGISCLVDGAHSPGMLDVSLRSLAADFWIGNFHKWVCAPKGSAVLAVGDTWRDVVRPLVTSHDYLRSFHEAFDWQGTNDPSAYLTIPDAIEFMGRIGWNEVRAHNDALARAGRDLAMDALRGDLLVRDDATGSMAIAALPSRVADNRPAAIAAQARFFEATRIEVPFVPWNGRGYVRISAHIYNERAEYERLAEALSGFGWRDG